MVVANGAVAGAVAAVLGAVVGVAGWIALAPRVEEAAGYRIDAFNMPWWLIVSGMLLAVVTAAGAAWWPARTMARIPPVAALSGRPPRPAPPTAPRRVAGAFIVGGIAVLALAGDVVDTTGDAAVNWATPCSSAPARGHVVGVLLVSPLAIRLLARAARRCRSPGGSRCVTSPATRPAPGPRWPRSASRSASPSPSSSPPPPPSTPPTPATCRTTS